MPLPKRSARSLTPRNSSHRVAPHAVQPLAPRCPSRRAAAPRIAQLLVPLNSSHRARKNLAFFGNNARMYAAKKPRVEKTALSKESYTTTMDRSWCNLTSFLAHSAKGCVHPRVVAEIEQIIFSGRFKDAAGETDAAKRRMPTIETSEGPCGVASCRGLRRSKRGASETELHRRPLWLVSRGRKFLRCAE